MDKMEFLKGILGIVSLYGFFFFMIRFWFRRNLICALFHWRSEQCSDEGGWVFWKRCKICGNTWDRWVNR